MSKSDGTSSSILDGSASSALCFGAATATLPTLSFNFWRTEREYIYLQPPAKYPANSMPCGGKVYFIYDIQKIREFICWKKEMTQPL